MISRAFAAGLWPLPYTVDLPDEVLDWARRGAAGVITNRPDLARGALVGER